MARDKKTTLVLPAALLARLQEAVQGGLAPSVSKLVRDAVTQHLDAMERQRRHVEMRAASVDPLFIRDVEACQQAFDSADAESARMMDPW